MVEGILAIRAEATRIYSFPPPYFYALPSVMGACERHGRKGTNKCMAPRLSVKAVCPTFVAFGLTLDN